MRKIIIEVGYYGRLSVDCTEAAIKVLTSARVVEEKYIGDKYVTQETGQSLKFQILDSSDILPKDPPEPDLPEIVENVLKDESDDMPF